VGLLSLAVGASTAPSVVAAKGQQQSADPALDMTGQPGTTPLPGSDVPTPFDVGKNRTATQRKAGQVFDNVPVDPGPSAPSPQTPPAADTVQPLQPEDRTIHNAPPKAINPEKPQPPR
jgi:hypothetical protein